MSSLRRISINFITCHHISSHVNGTPSEGATGACVEGAAAAAAADFSFATGVPTTRGGCVASTFTASPTTGMAQREPN